MNARQAGKVRGAGRARDAGKVPEAAGGDALQRYRARRDFAQTPEPPGDAAVSGDSLSFVIQKHAASRLHYDLRLELDGVMLSWAVPKGPSYDPADRRMAVQVEPHPISYNSFEGTIPPKQYGAGTVIVWDRGIWEPLNDPRQGLQEGKLVFRLHGQKMAGQWELVRIAKPGERQIAWLLFKKRDAFVRSRTDYDVVSALPDSVVARPVPPELQPASWAQGAQGAQGAQAAAAPRGDGAAGRIDPLAVARRAPLPATMTPQLATAAAEVPAAGRWILEIKFDGYRVMARIEHGKAKLVTRGGHDWTARMTELAAGLAALPLESAWLDGEIVVLGADGMPDFGALQNSFDHRRTGDIVYFVFDAPFLDGYDLRDVPLIERRALLENFLAENPMPQLRFSAAFDADPATVLDSARQLGLEGVIAKRADAPYVSTRSTTWLKLKCLQRQEFVIGGYTDRGNDPSAPEIGSLLLGAHDDAGLLRFVGAVGTGWDAEAAARLKRQLRRLASEQSPFADDRATQPGRWKRRAAGVERWVKPRLVAEVSFRNWTADRQLRHAVFIALRQDKGAREVRHEVRHEPAAPAVVVSNPQRVIDPGSGLTKLDLVRYYESVADWLLPHLRGRPCSLVRGPRGIGGPLFFQKHPENLAIPDLKALDPSLWPGYEPLMEIGSALAIRGAAQMNVIEFHTWNAVVRSFDQPDRIVFDLDPGDGVAWPRVQEAALLLRSFLGDLGLKSWLKTSGGKGLHVFVPLAPRDDWDTVRAFAQAVVQHVARVIPDRFVARAGATNRVGRVFIDYLRNSHGATTVAAYSARARPGLGVSMPIPWEMLDDIGSGAHWTIVDAREHLSFHPDDPWAGFWRARQTLTRAMKAIGFERPDPREPARDKPARREPARHEPAGRESAQRESAKRESVTVRQRGRSG